MQAICRKGALSKGGTPSAASSVHVPPTAQRNTTEPMGGEQEADMIFPCHPFVACRLCVGGGDSLTADFFMIVVSVGIGFDVYKIL